MSVPEVQTQYKQAPKNPKKVRVQMQADSVGSINSPALRRQNSGAILGTGAPLTRGKSFNKDLLAKQVSIFEDVVDDDIAYEQLMDALLTQSDNYLDYSEVID